MRRPGRPAGKPATRLGCRLRIARSARGLTLAQVAEAARVSIHTLSDLESGRIKKTGPAVALRLAAFLQEVDAWAMMGVEFDNEGTPWDENKRRPGSHPSRQKETKPPGTDDRAGVDGKLDPSGQSR